MKECKNSDILPCSEETVQGIIEALRKLEEASELEEASRRVAEYIFEDMLKSIKSDDMKKKTKKMTKAEAFEYLKGKKIKCICAVAYEDAQANKVERFLKDVGCKYHFANHISWRDWYWSLYGFIVDKNGEIYAAFEDQMDFFEQNFNESISADDILSIEIVENELSYDKVVELAKPLMEYLNEVGFRDSIRVSQYSISHGPMSTLIFDNGIGE